MSIGRIINEYRRDNKMSMQEFADKCGLSKGYISMLERGKHPQNNREIIPSIETIMKISRAMGLTIEELLGDADPVIIDISHSEPETDYVASDEEQSIIEVLRSLNDEGQHRVLEYVQALATLGTYNKD